MALEPRDENYSQMGNNVAKWTFIYTVLFAVGFIAAVFIFIW